LPKSWREEGRGRSWDAAFDSGSPLWQGARRFASGHWLGALLYRFFCRRLTTVVKPEWGTKRTCPKCGTRFYDLGKEDPVTCIECGTAWGPEPILKSKQPLPYDAPKKEDEEKADTDLSDDLDIDEDAEPSPDDDVDLGGDDDIGVATGGDDDES
jgi:uncharacterized protein (TIGR02300 family)